MVPAGAMTPAKTVVIAALMLAQPVRYAMFARPNVPGKPAEMTAVEEHAECAPKLRPAKMECVLAPPHSAHPARGSATRRGETARAGATTNACQTETVARTPARNVEFVTETHASPIALERTAETTDAVSRAGSVPEPIPAPMAPVFPRTTPVRPIAATKNAGTMDATEVAGLVLREKCAIPRATSGLALRWRMVKAKAPAPHHAKEKYVVTTAVAGSAEPVPNSSFASPMGPASVPPVSQPIRKNRTSHR